MNAYNYITGECLGPVDRATYDRYYQAISGLTSSQRDTGAVDGSDYGWSGLTIYIQ